MIKQGKTLIIGLSSLVAIAASTKMVAFPDEKLTTGSLKEAGEKKIGFP